MPRPKRSRIVSRPAAPLIRAKDIAKGHNSSEESDIFIKRKRDANGKPIDGKHPREYYMTGGLPAPTAEPGNSQHITRDDAATLPAPPHTSSNTVPNDNAVQEVSSTLPPSDDGGETHVSTPPAYTAVPPSSNLKQAPTPSILSIANFKRRPRQPSLLTMVKQRLAADESAIEGQAAENDESTLLTLGPESSPPQSLDRSSTEPGSSTRKRKAAEIEEVVESRLSPRPIAHKPSSPAEVEARPRESTRGAGKSQENARGAPQEQSRSVIAVPEPDVAIPSTESPSADEQAQQPRRRRSKPAEHVPASSQGRTRRSRKHTPSPLLAIATSPLETPPSSPLAPPSPSIEAKPQKRNGRHQQDRAPKHITTAALQSLLPRAGRRRKAGQTTQNFQIYAASSVEDADDNEQIDETEDELQRPTRPRRAAAKRRSPPKKALREKSQNIVSTKRTQAKNKKLADPKRATPSKIVKTYGRKSEIQQADGQGEKENEGVRTVASDGYHDSGGTDDVDDTLVSVESQESQKMHSKELAVAAKKFEQVDQWELSFESADVGGDESSPWR